MNTTIRMLSLSVAFVVGCGANDDPEPTRERSTPLAEPRMQADVFHAGIHVFMSDMSPAEVGETARGIKKTIVPGASTNSTCFSGPKGRVQLAVQTEFPLHEYVDDPEGSLELLGERLTAWIDEGFAVHLLLPLHYEKELLGIDAHWQGVDWAQAIKWSNSTEFVPMKPCPDKFVDGVKCPYDVVMEQFQDPVIQYLVSEGLTEKLAVIYVANEFGYDHAIKKDSQADWGPNWEVKRAEALAYTANRALSHARTAAQGTVPVGIKLIMVDDPDTGWAGAQLAWLLEIAMAPHSDVLGYDVYFDTPGIDAGNRAALANYLPLFADGRFEISEFGRLCTNHSTTRPKDVTDATELWSSARGLNWFAYNGSNCYSQGSSRKAAGAGLWQQVQSFTGAQHPEPCDEACDPVVDSVTPNDAILDQRQAFTVSGSCLPKSLAAWVAECDQLEFTSKTDTQAVFECTPRWTTGEKVGRIKAQPNLEDALHTFPVTVVEGCEPTVESVEPLTADLDQRQTFTITGTCLPSTIAAWIAQCDDLEFTSKTSNEATFECTPKWEPGTKVGFIKDEPDGELIFDPFEVEVY